MKKEKVIEYQNEKLRVLKRSISHLITCPKGVPLKFKYLSWKPVAGKYIKATQDVAAVILAYNSESFRIELIAIETDDYIHTTISNNQTTTALKFQYIEDWELIDKDDYPLFVGYKRTFPLLEKLLKRNQL